MINIPAALGKCRAVAAKAPRRGGAGATQGPRTHRRRCARRGADAEYPHRRTRL